MPLPKILFPTAHAVDYYNNLSNIIDDIHLDLIDFIDRKVKPYLNRQDSYKKDSLIDEIIEGLDQLEESAVNRAFSDATTKKLADQFAKRVKNHTDNQVKNQIRAVVDINVLKRNQKLQDLVKAAVSENVGLIKSIPREYHKQIKTVVLQGVRSGSSIHDIKDSLQDIYQKTDSRAKFIARDQAGSMLGDMSKTRHQEIGLKKFIWRDSADSRVRDKHHAFNGNTYTWEDGAGPNGLLPGKDYNCRCTAEVVEEEIESIFGEAA